MFIKRKCTFKKSYPLQNQYYYNVITNLHQFQTTHHPTLTNPPKNIKKSQPTPTYKSVKCFPLIWRQCHSVHLLLQHEHHCRCWSRSALRFFIVVCTISSWNTHRWYLEKDTEDESFGDGLSHKMSTETSR